MARSPADPSKPKVRRAPAAPKPIIVAAKLIENGPDGKPDFEIVAVTRDAVDVLDLLEKDRTIKIKKIMPPKRGTSQPTN